MTIIAVYLILVELITWIRNASLEYLKTPTRIFNLLTPGTIILNIFSIDSIE